MVWSYKRMLSLQRFWLISLCMSHMAVHPPIYVLLSVAEVVGEGLDLMLALTLLMGVRHLISLRWLA